ncbi:MAG: HEPN domain-containing protein [Planctomycetes bacterium]|nr:HEPN domain-containing protein [Planctomycetota bacterium]
MSVENLVASLLRVAKEDLDGARILARQGNRNAIYLCEQAAEKVIRAVLTSEGKHAGILHQLNTMVDQVPDANPMKAALRAVEHLGAYATSYRYPTSVGRTQPPPTASEIDETLNKVERALSAAVTGFKVDLSKSNAPAGSVAPLR